MKFTRTDQRFLGRVWLLVFSWICIAAFMILVTRIDPVYDSTGTGRRPLVIINGVTSQLPSADYISTVGGITTTATAAGSGDVQTATETVSSRFVDQGQLTASNTLTIATWTGSQTLSDWNPTGLSTAFVISMEQSSGSTQIDGIAAQPAGTLLTLYNRETSLGTIILSYETGTPGNQLVLPGAPVGGFPWKIQPGASLTIQYSGTAWHFYSSGTYEFPVIQADFAANLIGPTQVGQLKYTVQYDTSTGTQDPFVLFNSTTVVVWAGASDATFDGMLGNADGHHVVIINTSLGHTLTLANLTGTTSTLDYQNFGNVDAKVVGPGSYATYDYVTTPGNWQMTSFGSLVNAGAVTYTSSKNRGTIALAGGTGTATVTAGSVCTCTDTTGANAVGCAVSTTTLTATGTGTDVIAYLCF